MVVVVFGANGQLGRSLQEETKTLLQTFYFLDSRQVDITDNDRVRDVFDALKPNYCINAAAYTAVDLAESHREDAELVNHLAVQNIAQACLRYDTTLIHISTDFVFDGEKKSPYTEDDTPNPLSVYGQSKRLGELEIIEAMTKFFIVRTSWLYSDFGHNFKKTILRLSEEREEISVVNDQYGSPTHAKDLAVALVYMVFSGSTNYGIYHFCNERETSWYEFAKKILEYNKKTTVVNPIASEQYITRAKRPRYSVLDTKKIRNEFNLVIRPWDEALRDS